MKNIYLLFLLLLSLYVDAFGQSEKERIMIQGGTLFRYRSNNTQLSQRTRIGLSLGISRYFAFTANQKFGIRPELMMEAAFNRAEMELRDVDGIYAGTIETTIKEYTATPSLLTELHLIKWLTFGTGVSLPITLSHSYRVPPTSAITDDPKVSITSFKKLGVNIPIYAWFNVGKHMTLGARLDQGVTNRLKPTSSAPHQYDTNIRLLLGFKF